MVVSASKIYLTKTRSVSYGNSAQYPWRVVARIWNTATRRLARTKKKKSFSGGLWVSFKSSQSCDPVVSWTNLVRFFNLPPPPPPPLSSRPTPSEPLSGCSSARVALSARYKATPEWQRAREKPLSLFLRGLTPQSLQAARPANISHDILMKYDWASLLDWIYAYVTVHLLSLPYLCPSLKPILWSWGL